MLTEAVGTLILCFVWAKMRAAKCIPVHISFAFATLITVMIANIGESILLTPQLTKEMRDTGISYCLRSNAMDGGILQPVTRQR
jgi:hypothetical protein